MATIIVKCNPGKVIQGLDSLKKGVIRDLLNMTRKYLRIGAQELKSKHMSGPTSPVSVTSLSGKLKRSVKVIEPSITGQKITGGISVGDKETPQTRVLISTPRGKETVIKPKTKKFLAVPMKFAKTAKGMPRGPATIDGAPNPIWGITFIANNMIWGYKRGTARQYARPVPLFMLKKSVTVKSRIDLKEDVSKVILPPLRKELKMIVKTSRSGLSK